MWASPQYIVFALALLPSVQPLVPEIEHISLIAVQRNYSSRMFSYCYSPSFALKVTPPTIFEAVLTLAAASRPVHYSAD
ncbi:hypothetical protein C8J57DRAFT_1289544 [Mycena rebaudengoi]|nr:hypothetical protein C8J57DRAFT_1289544 [Mycena rebaudengoi]